MNNSKKYGSLTFEVHKSITFFTFGFLLLLVALLVLLENDTLALLVTITTIISVQVAYILLSYSSISITESNLKLKSLGKKIIVKDLKNITTWWSYDFGNTSPLITESALGDSNPTANKINCFVKFESATQVAYIREQIYLSGKFPNNHPYKPNAEIDKSKMIKVWDIDQCLKKLGLDKS